MKDAVLQVGLGKCSEDFVDLRDLNEFRDDSMLCEESFTIGSKLLISHCLRRCISLPFIDLFQWILIYNSFFIARIYILFTLRHNILIFSIISYITLPTLISLLMNKRKTNIILKLSDSEVHLHIISQLIIGVHNVEQSFGECTDYGFFIVIDHILEELINEFHFEVC